jgi:hypothetical protein
LIDDHASCHTLLAEASQESLRALGPAAATLLALRALSVSRGGGISGPADDDAQAEPVQAAAEVRQWLDRAATLAALVPSQLGILAMAESTLSLAR